MDMIGTDEIAAERLADWYKLGQGLHARYATGGFAAAARFVAAIGEAGDEIGHHPLVRLHSGFVELKLITDDAVYRAGDGTEHAVEWVTRQDLDLARRISDLAAGHGLRSDPDAVLALELVLDTASGARVAPFWSALLTGGPEAQGRGTLDDGIRDVTGRVPILSFQETDEHETPRQRFHVDVQVPHAVREQRVEAAVAAGGTVVDDSETPWATVLADPDGNRACVGVFEPLRLPQA